MPSDPSDPSRFDADIFGLPRRDEAGRPEGEGEGGDPLEVAIAAYLNELREGRSPRIEEHARRHPRLAEQLRELLPLVGAMEQWKSAQEGPARQVMPDASRFERLGNCRILREIGRGGMGVVFEAEQEPIGRRVALKVLPWRLPGSSQWRARFQREARMAASLQHPHIVPVYESGEQDGWLYYVMHLVEGIGIDRVIRLLREPEGAVSAAQVYQMFLGQEAADGRAPQAALPAGIAGAAPPSARILRRNAWAQFAKIGVQVADALRFSHGRGVLHRDIKPGNLLLDCRGSIWVTDFGLALDAAAATAAAAEQGLGGTLRYLAPEQLEGTVDPRSDIYALGVTLYELSTLAPVFHAQSADALIEQIRSALPPAPRAVNAAIPKALERIILRAIAKNPAQRYPSTDLLLTDLLQFAQGSADDRRSGGLTRLWPLLRRRRPSGE